MRFNALRDDLNPGINSIKTDRYALFTAIVCALLLILIIYSVYVRVQMYMLGLSLWGDEAKLVGNIVNRTFGEMLTPPLDNRQTAPVLYLIIVKALTMLFGASESVLRVFSFISLIVMLIAQGVLLRKVFGVRLVYTLFSVALSSVFLYFMPHSNELKSYMSDAAFVLVVIAGYYAYREGYLGRGIRSAVSLAAICSVCMLLATPATFAAVAVFVVEFLLKLCRKDKAAILLVVISGIIFIVVFALNYYFWLRPIATNEGMVAYWDAFKFSFNVFNRELLANNIALIQDLLEPVWHSIWIILPFAVCGFAVSLAKRNIYTLTIGVFFIIMLVASAIDKYPISNRLWMFLYVILFIYIYVFIDAIRLSMEDGRLAKLARTLIPLFLSCILLLPNYSFPAFGRGDDWTLTDGNQANPLIAYVQENIRDGEILYSYFSANNVLKFRNGWDTHRIGNVSEDNIIYGTLDMEDDVERIVETGGAYVLFNHSYYPLSQDWYIDFIVKRLQERGYMEQIMNVRYTYLYWFTDDISKTRASAELDLHFIHTDSGRITGEAIIENTGATILAPSTPGDIMSGPGERDPDRNGRLYLVLKKEGESDILLSEYVSPIRQGETVMLFFHYEGLSPGDYTLDLLSYGTYFFSELGMKTLAITVTD